MRRAAVALALAALAAACGGAQRPNIVVVLTDDQRWDELAFMPVVMERLVGEGVTFTNGFVPTPLCCPARASFLTGQYAHHHGIVELGGAPKIDDSATLAVWLHEAGYATALIGKYLNDNGVIAPRVPPGWDRWRTFADRFWSFRGKWAYFDYVLNEDGRIVRYGSDPADYSTDVLRAMALDFIRERAGGPFFLLFAPFAPHAPPIPAPRHAGALAALEHPRAPGPREDDTSDKPPHVQEKQRRMQALPPEMLAKWDARVGAERVAMLESLLAVDEAVAAILDLLDELGIADDTLVVFTSDNGEMEDEHWLVGKVAPYDPSIRVPLVVRYPRLVPEPREDDRLALILDLAPTFLELAGAPIPASVDGRSLAASLRDPSAPGREDFLIEFLRPYLGKPPYAGVRSRAWKYIRRDYEDAPFEELYDLANDPGENENLLHTEPGAHADVLDHLRRRLAELRPN